ncbi:MAG: ABC transporter ATP-binding protein [Campylobacterota bacterium]|nr:ABC transporter ATP-binding protein [Campylobacterota bacterium]
MSDNAIKVENLSKLYHLYTNPQDRLKEALNPFKKSYHTDFYAMDDVSFSIQKGETVGIVGKNGAGKSTLLKMITGVLTPTHGNIETHGKISSLLELGAGFNPEMSGFDNIYLNGSLMGFSKEQMDVRLDDIIDFADIGEFIHQPVKMYSSGMFARLAFSVAINVDPDILIVDEALSVGDLAFQMKCFKKFQDFQEQGRTILFVTHALDTVIRYCTRGIVIDGGKKVFEGTSKDAVDSFKKILSGDFYESDLEAKRQKAQKLQAKETENQDIKETNLLKDAFDIHKDIDIYGNHMAQIFDYGTLDNLGNPADILDYNSDFSIVMKVKFHEPIENPIFAFTLKDVRGLEITGTNTYMKHIVSGVFKQGDIATVTFKQKANLQLGKYALSLGCVNLNEKGVEVYNRIYDAMLFEIIGSAQMVGFYDLQSEITIA